MRFLPLAAALLLTVPSFADRVLYRGAKVTLMLPDNTRYETGRFMLMTTNEATVADDGHGGVRVGSSDWPTDSLPRARECTAVGPHILRKENRVRLVLNCIGIPQLHYFVSGIDGDSALELFHRFVAPGTPDGPAARALRDKAATRVAQTFFVGDLSSVSEEKRVALMKAITDLGATSLKKTIYRDAPYLDLNLGDHDVVFNTIQLDRNQRVARVTAEHLIPAARKLEEQLVGIDALTGVALTLSVGYKNFVNPTNAESGVDKIELFVPRAELTKLLRDEVTGQQLLANSVVRLNGSRVDVDLNRY